MHLEQYVRYIPVLGAVGLCGALAMYLYLKRQPVGTPRMREISGLIEQGAMAFLRREYIVLAPVVVVVTLLLAWKIGTGIAVAFVFGGFCSVAAGFMGMKSATKSNVRTTEAARTPRSGPRAGDRLRRRIGDGVWPSPRLACWASGSSSIGRSI